MQIASFREENENLKKQMFMVDKTIKQIETKYYDEKDALARKQKECDQFKKKY